MMIPFDKIIRKSSFSLKSYKVNGRMKMVRSQCYDLGTTIQSIEGNFLPLSQSDFGEMTQKRNSSGEEIVNKIVMQIEPASIKNPFDPSQVISPTVATIEIVFTEFDNDGVIGFRSSGLIKYE